MTADELQQQAALGNPAACVHLAKRLMRGRGGARNYEEAVLLFDRAARAGNADALYHLGKCYLKGLGCPKDPGGGVSCLEAAARTGHAAAALKLGECFERGEGAPRSAVLAAYWYGKAAARGESRAQAYMQHLQ